MEEQRRNDQANLLDLASFIRIAWPIVDPTPLSWNWHLDYLAEWLTLARMRVVKRVIFNIPPRTSKSKTTTVMFPAHCWTIEPSLKFITSSYESGLTMDFNVERRNIFQSSWFQDTWPDKVIFAKDQNQKSQYKNMAMGEMYATSMTGAVTGKGANFLLIDDPLNPKMAWSDVAREAVNREFDQTFRSRLNNPVEDVIFIIAQRTHEMDLCGYVMKKEPGVWTHISLPMIAERDEDIVFPISGRVVHRKKGEPLHPERFPLEWCKNMEQVVGPYVWAGQYQQRPAPLEGGIIKGDWIKHYRLAEIAGFVWEEKAQSWDMAFKKTKDSAYTAGHVWARRGADFYFLARRHEKMNIIDSCKGVEELQAEHPDCSAVYIEDKANGPAVMDILNEKIVGLVPVTVTDDKIARAYAAAPTFSSGHVYVPDPTEQPWINEVIQEWTTFPNSAYKDDTDAMTQALAKMRLNLYGVVDAEQEAARRMKEEEMKNKLGLAKVVVNDQTPSCPKCESKSIAKIGGGLRCSQCGHQWKPGSNGNGTGSQPMGMSRGDLFK